MKKRLSMLLAVCCLMAAFSMPASALEYTFEAPDLASDNQLNAALAALNEMIK